MPYMFFQGGRMGVVVEELSEAADFQGASEDCNGWDTELLPSRTRDQFLRIYHPGVSRETFTSMSAAVQLYASF